MANDQLIDEVISAVLFNKDMHDQSSWATAKSKGWDEKPDVNDPSCGATACIAGWACILTGQLFHWEVVGEDEDILGEHFVTWVAQWMSDHTEIQDAGRKALGLTRAEASRIFHTMDEEAAIDLLKRVKNGEDIVEDEDEEDDEEFSDDEVCRCEMCQSVD